MEVDIMTEPIWLTIVVGLIGIIIGGAGGAAILRRTFKIPEPDSKDDVTQNSSLAATVAATTAATFRVELTEHMKTLEANIATNNQRLTDLEKTVSAFLGACPERHKAIDRRLDECEASIREIKNTS